MKETGIVRRIDELGRIVIPKEMRRVLRMATGTPIEIKTTKEGEIVLSKYSVICELKNYANLVAKAIFDTMNMCVAVCDTDKVVSVAGLSKKVYVDSPIHETLQRAVGYRKPLLLNQSDQATMIPVMMQGDSTYQGQIIVPITKDGDVVGAIVVLADHDVSLADVKVVTGFATYLKLILEE